MRHKHRSIATGMNASSSTGVGAVSHRKEIMLAKCEDGNGKQRKDVQRIRAQHAIPEQQHLPPPQSQPPIELTTMVSKNSADMGALWLSTQLLDSKHTDETQH